MEISKIEEFESERFNALRLRTICFACWFLGLILIRLPLNNHVLAIIGIITAVFGFIFTYAMIRTVKVIKIIKKDPLLNQALMNEMYLSYDYKAVCTGFYSTLFFVVILFFTTNFIEIPSSIVCMAIIYILVISTDVRRLFLYKQ